jgi:hypothetical protein
MAQRRGNAGLAATGQRPRLMQRAPHFTLPGRQHHVAQHILLPSETLRQQFPSAHFLHHNPLGFRPPEVSKVAPRRKRCPTQEIRYRPHGSFLKIATAGFITLPLFNIGVPEIVALQRTVRGLLRLERYFAAGVAVGPSSSCSLRYTSALMSYVASSNPWPCVMASVGHASTQYPQKMQRE